MCSAAWPDCGEMPAGELHVAARRARRHVPRVVRRHPDPQPGQEAGHVLARERARLARRGPRAREDSRTGGRSQRTSRCAVLQLPARAAARSCSPSPLRAATAGAGAVKSIARFSPSPNTPRSHTSLSALLLRRRRQPPRGDHRDLERPLRRVCARQLARSTTEPTPRARDMRPRHREPVERHRDPDRARSTAVARRAAATRPAPGPQASRPASRQAAAATDPPRETASTRALVGRDVPPPSVADRAEPRGRSSPTAGTRSTRQRPNERRGCGPSRAMASDELLHGLSTLVAMPAALRAQPVRPARPAHDPACDTPNTTAAPWSA